MNQLLYRLSRIDNRFSELSLADSLHCDHIALHHRLVETVALIEVFLYGRRELARTLRQRISRNRFQKEKRGRCNQKRRSKYFGIKILSLSGLFRPEIFIMIAKEEPIVS